MFLDAVFATGTLDTACLLSIGRVAWTVCPATARRGQEGIDAQEGMLFRNLDIDLRYEVHPASMEAVLWIGSARGVERIVPSGHFDIE